MKFSLLLFGLVFSFNSHALIVKDALISKITSNDLTYHSGEWRASSRYVENKIEYSARPIYVKASVHQVTPELWTCLDNAFRNKERIDLLVFGFPKFNVEDASCVSGFYQRHSEELNQIEKMRSGRKVKQTGNAADFSMRELTRVQFDSKSILPNLSSEKYLIRKPGMSCKVSLGVLPGVREHAPLSGEAETAIIRRIEISTGANHLLTRHTRNLLIIAQLANGENIVLECMKLGKSARDSFTLEEVQHDILGSGVTLLE